MKTLHILGVGGLGFYLVAVGTFLYLVGVPYIVKDQVHQKVSLQNGSETYPVWKFIDFLEFNAYIFNVTNSDQVASGKKPIVKEIGPFCYKLHRIKREEDVDDVEDTVTYFETKYFYPTMSNTGKTCVPHDTVLTVLNVPLVATIQLLLEISPDLVPTFGEAVPLLFPGIKDAFLNVKASELLFEGIKLDCTEDDFTLGLICKSMKEMAPPQVRRAENGIDYLFAVLDWMNNTADGPFRILRGVKNVSDIGRLVAWDNKPSLSYWPSDDCNAYKGSDGYILPPIEEDRKVIDVFSSDLCRAVKLHYIEDKDILGIATKHFAVKEDALAEAEHNKCFCPWKKDEDTEERVQVCLKKGVINLAPCLNKAPVIFSWPHFYMGADEYLNAVEGLTPDPEKHRTEEYIETRTGAPVTGVKRAQANLFLEQNEDIEVLEEIHEGILPLLWIEEGALIPKDFRTMLKAVSILLKLLDYMLIGMVLGGIGCLGAFVFLCLFHKNYRQPVPDDPPVFQPFDYKPQGGGMMGIPGAGGMNQPYPMMNGYAPTVNTVTPINNNRMMTNNNNNSSSNPMVRQYNMMNTIRNSQPEMNAPPPPFNRLINPGNNQNQKPIIAPQYTANSFYD